MLPKYRGVSCIQAALANGDVETGITVMRVIRELDAGDIISAQRIPIGKSETAGELHDRLADLGPAALAEALETLAANPKAGTPQIDAEVTYAPKLLREDGRLIRAHHPWPGTFSEVAVKGRTKRLKIFPPVEIAHHPLRPANSPSTKASSSSAAAMARSPSPRCSPKARKPCPPRPSRTPFEGWRPSRRKTLNHPRLSMLFSEIKLTVAPDRIRLQFIIRLKTFRPGRRPDRIPFIS
jgi:hypothetical protein